MSLQPYLIDFHIHSRFSPDAESSLEDICQQAMRRGLSEIAITDHAELRCGAVDELDFSAASREIRAVADQYAGRLKVRLGIELGQPQDNPSLATRYYQTGAVDFIIGSVHVMADGSDPYLEDYTRFDPIRYYSLYLDRLTEYATSWDFDVLGHLTYPLRYMHMQLGRTIDLAPFTDRFRALFSLLREKEKGIEVNVSGYRQSCGEPFPAAQVLRIYRESGCELITLGSDSHRVQDVGEGIETGYALLKELGFPYLTTFCDRKPEMHHIR